MPPTLRKRKDIDYSEAPRSKRVKLDPLKAEPSKSERPDRSSRRQPRAPAVAPGLHPTAAPTRRKTQEKTDKLLHKPAEASNRGRKEKRGPEEDLLTERKPEAPSTPQPLTEENLHAFDSATKMPKVLTRQPTQNGTESQTATGTTRSRKLSQKKAAELLTKHRIYLERGMLLLHLGVGQLQLGSS